MTSKTEEKTLQHNLQLLDDFIKDKIHVDHINNISQRTIRNTLRPFVNYNKKPIDFYKNITESQLIHYIEQYGITSRRVVISRLKEFCRFIHNLEMDDQLPDSIRRIKPPTKREIDKTRSPNIEDKIITPEEYNLLITKGSSHPMHKALIETLYLFGVRPSELISMNIKHVKEDEKTKLTTIEVPQSKTMPRAIPTNENPQYLLDWIYTYHPNKNQPNQPLWINQANRNRGARLQTYSVYSIVKTMSKNAGITRNIYPYMLRHTSITIDSAKDIPRTHLETKFGWKKGTPMLNVYDHNGTESYKKYLIETTKPMTEKTRKTLEQENKRFEGEYRTTIQQQQNKIAQLEKNLANLESMIKIKIGLPLENIDLAQEIHVKHDYKKQSQTTVKINPEYSTDRMLEEILGDEKIKTSSTNSKEDYKISLSKTKLRRKKHERKNTTTNRGNTLKDK